MALRREWPQVKTIVLTGGSGDRNVLDTARSWGPSIDEATHHDCGITPSRGAGATGRSTPQRRFTAREAAIDAAQQAFGAAVF